MSEPIVEADRLAESWSTNADRWQAAVNFALLDPEADELLAALRRIAADGAAIVIQALHPGAIDGPYVDGWRIERFDAFGAEGGELMPWYYRTLSSWLRLVGTRWHVDSVVEPLLRATQRPASLLITARAA